MEISTALFDFKKKTVGIGSAHGPFNVRYASLRSIDNGNCGGRPRDIGPPPALSFRSAIATTFHDFSDPILSAFGRL
jgi:hypothetical protein